MPLDKNSLGDDGYFFILARKHIIEKRDFSFILSNIIIDENKDYPQNYPPMFSILLILIPERILTKYHRFISPIIDSIIGVLISFVSFYLWDDYVITAFVGVAYSTNLASIHDTVSLTSRQFGNLLYFLCFYTLGTYYTLNDDLIWLIGFAVFSFLLLLTHMLTSQGFFITLIGLSVYYFDLTLLAMIPAIIIIAIILSFGHYYHIFFKNQLEHWAHWGKCHADVAKHQVYDSPEYSKPEDYIPLKAYGNNIIQEIFISSKRIIASNIFIFSLIGYAFIPEALNPLTEFFLVVFLTILCISYLMNILPFLRFLGRGEKYMKLVAWIPAILGINFLQYNSYSHSIIIFVVTLLVLSFIIYFIWVKSLKSVDKSKAKEKSKDLSDITQYIDDNAISKIFCIPHNYIRHIMFHTKSKVFWGLHMPMKRDWVDAYHPVLYKPIKYFQDKFDLEHLLLDHKYCDPIHLKLQDENLVYKNGTFSIYKLNNYEK